MHFNYKATFKNNSLVFMIFFVCLFLFLSWDLSTFFSINIFIFGLCVHERKVRVGNRKRQQYIRMKKRGRGIGT